jgi:hypothetical protein
LYSQSPFGFLSSVYGAFQPKMLCSLIFSRSLHPFQLKQVIPVDVPSKFAEDVPLLTCSQEVPSSNLGRITDYPDIFSLDLRSSEQ